MKHKDWVALFKIFLEMNDALIPYLEGLQGPRGAYVGTELDRAKYFILNAFVWRANDGKSNNGYWKELHLKWEEVMKDVNSRA